MIIAITGGTGFIGKHLIARLLREGEKVRVLSRSKNMEAIYGVAYYQGDLMKEESLIDFLDGVDVLYHCAGQLIDEVSMRKLHVGGTKHLIAAASGNIKHWVQLSSVGVYGAVSKGTVTEEFPLNPVGEYEITKAESDGLVIAAAKQGKFTYSVLRPSNVFAADMTNQSLFSMIKMIEKGLFFFIGSKGASANYIHVDNVVEALLLCGEHENAKGKIFNISDCCTIEIFVQIISELLVSRATIFRMPESPVRWAAKVLGSFPNFPLTTTRIDALMNRSIYSIERIKEDVGYRKVIGMEDGLRQLVTVYKGSQ